MLDLNHRSGAKPPGIGQRINDLVDAHLARANQEKGRTYLGASVLGAACDRAIQLDYLSSVDEHAPRAPPAFEGRILRIFSAGHHLEDLTASWLKGAGLMLKTRDRDGNQFGFSVAGGRFRGHVDGVIVEAPPEVGLRCPALWEHKALNARGWQEVARKGVAIARPAYAAQVALYQAYLQLDENPALFTVLNKDTSELHHELVPFDGALAQRTSDRAVAILRAVDAGDLLPRPFQSPDHHECARCRWKEWCWGPDRR